MSMVKIQAVQEKAENKAIKFQIDCGASANVLPPTFTKDIYLGPCTKTRVM